MSKEFIITEEQKNKLKALLSEEEYDNLIKLEWREFFLALNDCIVYRFEDDEPTEEAWHVQRIYDEIYLQN